MGYHKTEIQKGELGEFSKIREEIQELMDARLQEAKVLEICELCDLLGAIESYVVKQYNLKLSDLQTMMEMTKDAFQEGKR